MAEYKEAKDLLSTPLPPDRLHFELGTMLGAEDFFAEQAYHRGRLARALQVMFGAGTVAGLNVSQQLPDANQEEEIRVTPGIAIDRLGRLIEVPRIACIRLNRWYRAQDPSRLAAGFAAGPGAVTVDLFLRFVPCERGRTQVFANTAFEGLSAVAASRIRDGYSLDLVIREEEDPPLPEKRRWPAAITQGGETERRDALESELLRAGRELGSEWERDELTHLPWQPETAHPTAEFLARLQIAAANGLPPVRPEDRAVVINNLARRFVYPATALAQLAAL